MIETLSQLFLRDFEKLKTEISSYKDEKKIWEILKTLLEILVFISAETYNILSVQCLATQVTSEIAMLSSAGRIFQFVK